MKKSPLSIIEPISTYLPDTLRNDEFSFILLAAIVSHRKLKETMKGCFDRENLLELLLFYPHKEIDEIIKKLEKIPNKLLNILERKISSYFDKEISSLFSSDLLSIIPLKIKKKYAMYYTKKAVASLLSELVFSKKISSVLDPSCGNGILLSNLHKLNPNLDLVGCDISSLTIIDKINFEHLGKIDFLKLNEIEWKKEQKSSRNNFDLIIMNPPYTRPANLSLEYRKFLFQKFKSNSENLGQMGLHCYFIKQADKFLKPGGTLAAVLPASVLYAKYAKSIRDVLLNNYEIKFLISYESNEAFSYYSSFKEILLIAKKNQSMKNCTFVSLQKEITNLNKTEIITNILKNRKNEKLSKNFQITKKQLQKSNNWLEFFKDEKIRDVLSNTFEHSQSKIVKIGKILEMRRGVETFGPEFFFIPNRFWKVKKITNSSVLIYNQQIGKELCISQKYLSSGLTSPKNYSKTIIPNIREFLVTIPPLDISKLPQSIRDYINWGLTRDLAIRHSKFATKKPWYSFLYEQLKKETFFGNVFILRKIRLGTMGVLAHFTSNKFPASKGFYVLKNNSKFSKALTLWFNSSFFLKQLLNKRRSISNEWGELMISDLKELYCIDFSKIPESKLQQIEEVFDKFSKKNMSPVIQKNPYRVEVDKIFLKILDMPGLNIFNQ